MSLVPFPTLSRLMSGPKDTLLRELLLLAGRPEVISFAGGLPSPEGFPVADVREAADRVLNTCGARALQYSYTEGETELRQAIASFETSRGTPTTPEEVQIVSGSQQALDLIARCLIDENSRVLVENPTYMGALQAFRACNPTFELLPSDDLGLNPQLMGEECRGARFAYVMPTFANPTGLTMNEKRREKLVERARELDLWIVEDDPYGELWYETPPIASIRSRIPERTLRLGTLSKVLSPGLRLGYICGPKPVLEVIGLLKQTVDLHTSTLTQRMAADIIASGRLEAHLPSVRALYQRQAQTMLEALAQYMPEGVAWTNVQGGMFIWMTLPESIDTTAMMKTALDHNVAYVPGEAFYALGGDRHHLRLSFVTVPEDRIREGVRRLAKLIRQAIAVA